MTQLRNPGQKDAFKYGSAFSRGARIAFDEGVLLELSGTAAIDETGASLYPGDPAAQIDCTLDKIETLLGPLSIEMSHLAAGTAFIKDEAHVDRFKKALAERGLDDLPLIPVVADVCRGELLFEIDAEFVKWNR